MKSPLALSMSLIIAGLLLSSQPANAQDEQHPNPDESIRKLLVERRDTLRELLKKVETYYKSGKMTFDDMVDAHTRLFGAELELADTKEERIKLRQQQVTVLTEMEKVTKKRTEKGIVGSNQLLLAKAARLQAEIDLLREQAESD